MVPIRTIPTRAFKREIVRVKEAPSTMANITRFDPLNEMVSLRSAMDRLFEDSFVNPMSWRTISGTESVNAPIDVHETADDLERAARIQYGELPEMEKRIGEADVRLRELQKDSRFL